MLLYISRSICFRGSHRVSFNYYGYCENSVQIPRQNNNRQTNSQRRNPMLMPISSSPPQTFTTDTNSILPPNGFVPGGIFTQRPMVNGANGFVDSRGFFFRPAMFLNDAARQSSMPGFFSGQPAPFNSGPVRQAFIPAANLSPRPSQGFGSQPMSAPQIFAPQPRGPPQGFGPQPIVSSQDFWSQPMVSSQPLLSIQPPQTFFPSTMTSPQFFISQPMGASPGFPSSSSLIPVFSSPSTSMQFSPGSSFPRQILAPTSPISSTLPGVSPNFASVLGSLPVVSSQDFFAQPGIQNLIINGPPPPFEVPPQSW